MLHNIDRFDIIIAQITLHAPDGVRLFLEADTLQQRAVLANKQQQDASLDNKPSFFVMNMQQIVLPTDDIASLASALADPHLLSIGTFQSSRIDIKMFIMLSLSLTTDMSD